MNHVGWSYALLRPVIKLKIPRLRSKVILGLVRVCGYLFSLTLLSISFFIIISAAIIIAKSICIQVLY